jgi:hypothetical protein
MVKRFDEPEIPAMLPASRQDVPLVDLPTSGAWCETREPKQSSIISVDEL